MTPDTRKTKTGKRYECYDRDTGKALSTPKRTRYEALKAAKGVKA